MKTKKNKNINLFFIVVSLVLIFCVFSAVIYARSTDSIAWQQANEVLKNSEDEQVVTLSTAIRGQFSSLNVLASSIISQEEIFEAEVVDQLSSFSETTDFEHLIFCDATGTGISGEGCHYNLSKRYYFDKPMSGEQTICKVKVNPIDGDESYLISVPLIRDETIKGAVIGIIKTEMFENLLSTSAYSGSSTSVICDKFGNIISGKGVDTESIQDKRNNIFMYIENAKFTENLFKQLKSDFFQTKRGNARFSINGKEKCIVYSPIGYGNWMIANIISKDAVKVESQKIILNGHVWITVVAGITITIALILMLMRKKQNEMTERENDYIHQLSLYRTSDFGGVLSLMLCRGLKLIYANDKFYKIMERTKDDFEAITGNDFLSLIAEEERDAVMEQIKSALIAQKSGIDLCTKLVFPDGQKKYVQINTLFNKPGESTVLNGTIWDITLQKETEQELEREKATLIVSRESLNIALENASVDIWEYDIQAKTIRQSLKTNKFIMFGDVLTDIPESIIENGSVHPDSVDEFREMYKKLAEGQKKVSGVFRMLSPDRDTYIYERIRYTSVPDSQGRPYMAIGVSENVTETVEAEQRYVTEMGYRNNLVKEAYISAAVNLNTNHAEFVNWNGKNDYHSEHEDGFEYVLRTITDLISGPQSIKNQIAELSPELLCQKYDSGDEILNFEFEHTASTEPVKWFSLEMRLDINPANSCHYAYIYLRDITQRVRQIEKLEKKASTDPLTGLYNVATAREMINSQIISGKGKRNPAMLMLDIDNFKQVNDTFGHVEGDNLIREMSDIFRNLFGNDIAARIGGDEFVVFIKNALSRDEVAKKADSLLTAAQIKKTLNKKTVCVSCSIGISMPDNSASLNYDTLYNQADQALYASKNAGKNRYSFF